MNDCDNDDSVQQWLAKAYWPWPLALAYSIGSNRQAAIKECVSILDGSAEVSPEYVGLTAVHLTYAHAIGDPSVSQIDWNQMQTIERPLVAAVEADKIAWRGRPAPGQPLGNPCDGSQWIGAEIHALRTSDLVQNGYRQFHGDLETVLDERQRKVWLHDIHLKAADVKKAVDGEPRMLAFIKHPVVQERVLFEEMMETALHGRPSSDTSVYEGPDGEIAIVPHPSVIDPAKEFAETIKGYRQAAKALVDGILTCLVEAKDTGQVYKIPRHYWFLASSNFSRIENRDNVPSQFVGQPVQVELRHLESWKALLSPLPSPACLPRVERDADDNWTKRALTRQQITAMEFLDKCGGRLRDGEAKQLLGRYEIWVSESPDRGEPLGKTAFNKWHDRYRQGYRVDGRKLVHPS